MAFCQKIRTWAGRVSGMIILPTILISISSSFGSWKNERIQNLTVNKSLGLVSAEKVLIPDKEPMSAKETTTAPLPDSIRIPLIKAGSLFFFEATIDGQTGNLLFDSGCSGLVLNKTYFRNYRSLGNQTSSGVTGDIQGVERIRTDSLIASGLVLKGLSADLANLAHIENRRGVKVLGLFGLSMIRDYEVIIDLNQAMLELHRIDRKGNRIEARGKPFPTTCRFKLERSGSVLFIRGSIGDQKLRFCLDTGAELNVLSSSTPETVLGSIRITNRKKLSGAGESKTEVLLGSMSDFRIQEFQLAPMETLVADLRHLTLAYGVQTDGVLGYSFFQKGVFCLNLIKKEMGFISSSQSPPS